MKNGSTGVTTGNLMRNTKGSAGTGASESYGVAGTAYSIAAALEGFQASPLSPT
jgi:hypothetical protein